MIQFTIQTFPLTNVRWSKTTAKAGEEIELLADAPQIQAGQSVEFLVRHGDTTIAKVVGADGAAKAKWKVPNFPAQRTLKFKACLREKPGPANGHSGVVQAVDSNDLTQEACKIEIGTIDAAFVPSQEKLEVAYTVTDPSRAAKKGRIEVWGERYPGDEAKPLFVQDFSPAPGAGRWKNWDGKANAGLLKGKFITPEFSPYRVRLIIGPDSSAVADPYGVGSDLVAIAEAQFEIKFQSVRVRTQDKPHKKIVAALERALVVEPRTARGEYAAKGRTAVEKEPIVAAGWATGQGALPERDGVGRIRIDCTRHTQIGESLNQGSSAAGDPATDVPGNTDIHRVGDPYQSAGASKFSIDANYYTRPELPFEIEPRLKSRDAAKNLTPDFGLFEKKAVGPAVFDVFVEDVYKDDHYTSPYAQAQTYFKKAAMQVKRGTESAPFNNAGAPEIGCWQQRFPITANVTPTDEPEVGDTTHPFVVGSNELTVFRNRTKLKLDVDYTEETTNRIKFKKNVVRKDDVIWIIRTLGADAVARWNVYPPGDNCHLHYGGIRGKAPSDDEVHGLRKTFSPDPAAPLQPIVGKGPKDFPYTSHIKLDPHDVTVADREQVESQAVLKEGPQQGLAGIIFSPSVIAGDRYAVHAVLTSDGYTRTLGYEQSRDQEVLVKGKTGQLNVWRLATISASWRMPSAGTGGLGEQDQALAARVHPGDGRNMNFADINARYEYAFTEWKIDTPDGDGTDPHKDIDLSKYRKFFNTKFKANEAGFYELKTNADVFDHFVGAWEPFTVELPRPLAANRVNVANWALEHRCNRGDDPATVAAAVHQTISDFNTANTPAGADSDGATNKFNAAITARNQNQYKNWVKATCKSLANEFMDSLIPQINPAKTMRVMRWPRLYWDGAWLANNGTGTAAVTGGLGIGGYCRGSGQAFFFSISGQATTFQHEMGHSLFLAHFAAASATNFAWKHHDHDYATCLMGYNAGDYYVPLPAAATGPPIRIRTQPRDQLCPKCLLKVRGWKETVLPANWGHPDVF